ncbi:N-acetylglucosamine repressor [subsurface metagenome]
MDNIRRGNKQLIKELNRAIVINIILNYGPISRTRISEITDLGLSTVSNIVADLIKKELIYETGEEESSGGRRAILLEFNCNDRFVLGIKIGLDGIIIGLVNMKSKILSRHFIPSPVKSSERIVLEVLIKAIRNLIDKNSIEVEKIIGCGIGVSGLVNQKEGTLVFSKILAWKEIRFKELLEKEFNFPIFVDKDVNALTLAEKRFGVGKKINNFICITIGKGVGAGIVIKEDIYRGSYGGAGDFGHIIIDKDGPLCYCGKRGCLETFSSDQFIINKIKGALSNQQDTIKDFLKKKEDLNSITVDTVLKAAQKGDIISKNIFQEVGKNLAMGIVNLISLFDPELIVVGGEGVKAGELIFPTMRKVIRDNFPFKKEIKIVPLQPGEEGWIIGAAELVLSEVFKTPIFKSKGKVAIKSAFRW